MISVIVPIYNVKKYLRQCIESILKQTYEDFELILVDDGSIDGCYDICEYYREMDPRVRVLHKKNEGLVKARKDGLQMSRGEYIAYVDGDDWIESDMLEKMYTTLKREDVDIVMCGRYEDTEEKSKAVYHGIGEGRYDKNALISDVYHRMIRQDSFFEWGILSVIWDKLYKRKILIDFQMAVDNRLTMGEDAACVYPCILNADSIYILHECLYHYRQSPTSMIKNQTNTILEQNKFKILYYSVMNSFERYNYKYDLKEQWKDFLLFLMVPRAGSLYKDMEKLDYLFPFVNVKRGSKIILYGMGTYGQFLSRWIVNNGFCELVAIVDRNYKELCLQGFEVVSPQDIDKYEFDAIVVANMFASIQEQIVAELSATFPREKIHCNDVQIIRNEETMKAFGLIGNEE